MSSSFLGMMRRSTSHTTSAIAAVPVHNPLIGWARSMGIMLRRGCRLGGAFTDQDVEPAELTRRVINTVLGNMPGNDNTLAISERTRDCEIVGEMCSSHSVQLRILWFAIRTRKEIAPARTWPSSKGALAWAVGSSGSLPALEGAER